MRDLDYRAGGAAQGQAVVKCDKLWMNGSGGQRYESMTLSRTMISKGGSTHSSGVVVDFMQRLRATQLDWTGMLRGVVA